MGGMAAAGEVEAFRAANETFHALIYEGAHNSLLEDAVTALRRRVAAYRRAQFRNAGRLPSSHAEHEAVVKAIISGEPAKAHAAMLQHVDLVGASFEKLISQATPARAPQT
jgi:DNA-binding GntR family transcriptional regulator